MTVCPVRRASRFDQSSRSEPQHPVVDAMTDVHRVAQRQSGLPREVLAAQQAALLGPTGHFANLSRQIRKQGRQAPLLNDINALEDRDRRALAEQALQFVLAVHCRRPPTDNPFHGMTREYLCCVVFDEAAPYTLVERYAAGDALRQVDSDYFSKLIATTRDTVERRVVFHGLLEHFDRLLPIEKSIYPLDYRAVQKAHLDHEEALYGKLDLAQPIHVILEIHEPQWLIDHLCELERPAH